MMDKINLKSLSQKEIEDLLSTLGQPGYRAKQLMQWIYERGVESIGNISVFSKDLRSALGKAAYISNLKLLKRLTSKDGTEKYLFGLEDDCSMESVLIPDDERTTLCISSQVGCAMGCKFCLTGKGGFTRNLMAHEIADQVMTAGRLIRPGKITNIVLMGMGEPLRNLDQVALALKTITGPLGFSPRRVTLSTSGLVREMLMLPKVAPRVNLAISLNATTDEVRDAIMPVNRKHPLRALLDACRRYPLDRRSRITFEYVMLGGVNDTPDDAGRLALLIKGIPSKVNLIPFNEFKGSLFHRPTEEAVLTFQSILDAKGVNAFIRKSKGRDILAACGQLGVKREQGA